MPLFRPLTKNKSGYSLRNGKLSYTSCRKIFKTTLRDLGYDPKEYGLHSLRSGGATAVISNNASKAVSERLLKLHGRWKTDEAKDMCVLETECNRLSEKGEKDLKSLNKINFDIFFSIARSATEPYRRYLTHIERK